MRAGFLFICYTRVVKSSLRLAWLGVFGLALVVVGNTLAYRFAWYWRFSWLDVLMHLIGGLTVALLIIGLTPLFELTPSRVLMAAIVAGLLVGVLWELAQYYGYVLGWQSFNALQLGWSDTLLDLASDACGGVVAWFCWLVTKKYGTTN